MSETNNPRWAPKTFRLLGADRRPYPSTTPGAFGGHRRSRIYGRLDCPAALRSIAGGGYVRHRVFFADETTAIAAGYRPCGTCLPDKYRAWKSRDVGRHGLPRLALAAVPIPPAGHRRERQSSPRLPGLVAATGDPRAGDDYAPDTALLNFYEEHARLGMHHDKEELSHARP
ncbi:Ada metal-binding domain-containing protein [Actinoplanes sp. NPDC051343]|uniref:Ada metal-binding domain-containing protein n=1 Tax=Actinoplanes sp. NPDC051343 TaxID=3363906 RepID=UPI0037BA092B